MKKIGLILLTLTLIGLGPVFSQSINLKVGLDYPFLESDLWEMNQENLTFEKQDMVAAYYGLEYEHFLGRNASFFVEGGYYEKEHNGSYRDIVYIDDSPIYQSLSLKVASLEMGFKMYPVGHRRNFCPFIGVGAGMYYWKYEQWGDFYDSIEDVVNQDEYVESSTYSPGFNARAGFVFRFDRNWGMAFETRYRYLKGNLSSNFEGFEDLDLSGITFTLGINFNLR